MICVKTLYIEPGSPWENGYCERSNSKLSDELLAGEQFSTLTEAQVLIERSRPDSNLIPGIAIRGRAGEPTSASTATQCCAGAI